MAKRKLASVDDFAVGDVIFPKTQYLIEEVVGFDKPFVVTETLWSNDGTAPDDALFPPMPFAPCDFTILASPFALATEYCGYEEP